MHPSLKGTDQTVIWNTFPDMVIKRARHRFVGNGELLRFWIELQRLGVVLVQPNFKNKPNLFSAGIGAKHRRAEERDKILQ